MRLLEHYLLQEKKDHLIKKLTNLTDIEKEQVIAFFAAHSNLENKIDWNNKNLQMSDFQIVMKSVEQSRGKIKKNGLAAFKQGVDYIDVSLSNEIQTFIPLTYKFQKFIQSANFMEKEAEWCIGYQKTDEYWKKYGEHSIFLIFATENSKLAYQLSFNKELTGIWNIEDEDIKDDDKFWKEDLVIMDFYKENEEYFLKSLDPAVEIKKEEEKNKDLTAFKNATQSILSYLEDDTDFSPSDIGAYMNFGIKANIDDDKKIEVQENVYKLFPKVESLKSMFRELDFSFYPNFDFSKLQLTQYQRDFGDMNITFSGAKNLTADLSHWVFSSPVSLTGTFSFAENMQIKMGENNPCSLSSTCKNVKNSTFDFTKFTLEKVMRLDALAKSSENVTILFDSNNKLPQDNLKPHDFLNYGESSISLNINLDPIFLFEYYEKEFLDSITGVDYSNITDTLKDISIIYEKLPPEYFSRVEDCLQKLIDVNKVSTPFSGFDMSYFSNIKIDTQKIIQENCPWLIGFSNTKNFTKTFTNNNPDKKDLRLQNFFWEAENCHITLENFNIISNKNLFYKAKNCTLTLNNCTEAVEREKPSVTSEGCKII